MVASLLLSVLFVASTVVSASQPPPCMFGETCTVGQWKAVERAQPHVLKTLLFAIKQSNTDLVSGILSDVSNPDSPSYGKYLSFEQVGELVRNDVSLKIVKKFLIANGIPDNEIDETANGEFLTVRTPVQNAERLLSSKFFVFEKDSVRVLRTDSVTVPEDLRDHIDFIGATTQLPGIRRRSIVRGREVNGYVTPQLLNDHYNVKSNVVKDKRATQSLFESLGQDFSPADLAMFQQRLSVPASKISKVIGPNDPSVCDNNMNSCGEANLDVQYILSMSPDSPTTYWSVEQSNDLFVDWVAAVANDPSPPLVHSISYGGMEYDNSMMDRFSLEVQKLGLRGVTVVVSSGDDGVSGAVARESSSECGFNPSFPASCPFVVAVGATQGPESGEAEIACSSATGGIVTSGGGFSNVYPQPSYQSESVSEFFKNSAWTNLPPSDEYNAKGRAYPDVSMLGFNYIIVDGQQLVAVSGTSASSPVFAGLLSLVNGELLASGRPSLGFVNPLLYKLRSQAGVYNDITEGSNNCAAGPEDNHTCCSYGFTATSGWDPVTGLGSINFENFKDAVLSYSPKGNGLQHFGLLNPFVAHA